MKVEKDGKTLYHIQSVTDWHDEPYDMFVYAKTEGEVVGNLRKLYIEDCSCELSDSKLDDLVEYSNIYNVYAEEL